MIMKKYYLILFVLSFFLLGCITVDIPIPDGINTPNKEHIKQKEQRSYDELDKETKK